MINFIDLLPSIRLEIILNKQASLLASMKREKTLKEATPDTPQGKKLGFKEVIDVGLADDGSIRTYLKDLPYPVRIYPLKGDVAIIENFKRLFILLLRSGFWGLLALYFCRKVWSKWLNYLIDKHQIAFKDGNWSQPIKELRRVLKDKLDSNFLDAISVILEYDGGYRYRVQDIVGEINKKNFGYKEIVRLCDLFLERETDRNKPLWIKLRKWLWLVRFIGLKQIKQIVKELNIDELRFNECDLYHLGQYRLNGCGFYKFEGKNDTIK